MGIDTEPTGAEGWLTGRTRYPVYYEDTDFSGYVYHANYLKYFERGREELIGLDYVRELYERGIHFVVARVELAYHYPARHGDYIEILTRMRLSASPVGLVEQTATRLAKGTSPEIKLVSGKIKVVAVDAQGETMRLPPDVVAHFQDLAKAP